MLLSGAASIVLAVGLAARGLKKKSLAPSGAVAAAVVGAVTMASGLEFGVTLILFYLTSSKLTKWRSELKAQLEADHAVGGQRGATQVLANSLVGAALAAATAWLRCCSGPASSGGASVTAAAFVGFYACCCADTWSSEVGIASAAPPRLITTWRRVPPGTNGGVSLLGAVAAAAGGLLMGCSYVAAALVARSFGGGDSSSGSDYSSSAGGSGAAADWRLVPLALAAGIVGSALDSLLGATLQYSGFDERSGRVVSGRPAPSQAAAVKHISGLDLLSNTAVNVAASLLTASLAAGLAWRWAAVA